MKIKQFNNLYSWVVLLSYPLIIKLVFWNYANLLTFGLMVLYGVWVIYSMAIIYYLKREYGLKKEFIPRNIYKGTNTTFWIDKQNGELAILCRGNPFKIIYIAIEDIDSAEIKISRQSYNGKNYENGIDLLLFIKGKKNLLLVDNYSGAGSIKICLNIDKQCVELQYFIDIIMKIKNDKLS